MRPPPPYEDDDGFTPAEVFLLGRWLTVFEDDDRLYKDLSKRRRDAGESMGTPSNLREAPDEDL